VRGGRPAGTEIAVIAKANFIFHELAEIFHRIDETSSVLDG
jgi:hypothetical protein